MTEEQKVAELCRVLEIALRQWRVYRECYSNLPDLEDDNGMEGDLYRQCKQVMRECQGDEGR